MKVRSEFARSASVEGSGGAAPAPAPADTGASNAAQAGISDDIRSVFEWDPFEPTPPENVPAATPTPEPVAATPPPVAQPATPVPPPPAPVPTPDPTLAAVTELRQTVTQLPEMLREATRPAQPQQPEPDQWAPMADGQPLNYGALMQQVPDQLIASLGSENPLERKQAIANLLAISTHVAHRNAVKQAMEMVRSEMRQVLPAFVNNQLTEHVQRQQVFQDFYGNFPALANESLRPLVMQQAQALAAETGARGWSPEFRNRLGERVMSVLRGAVPQTAPVAQAPTMTPSSVRPTAPRVSSMQQEIDSLF